MNKMLNELIEELEESGIDVPKSSIKKEPETSTKKLQRLELEFGFNTYEVIEGKTSSIPDKALKQWKDAYENFKFFNGAESKINTQE